MSGHITCLGTLLTEVRLAEKGREAPWGAEEPVGGPTVGGGQGVLHTRRQESGVAQGVRVGTGVLLPREQSALRGVRRERRGSCLRGGQGAPQRARLESI